MVWIWNSHKAHTFRSKAFAGWLWEHCSYGWIHPPRKCSRNFHPRNRYCFFHLLCSKYQHTSLDPFWPQRPLYHKGKHDLPGIKVQTQHGAITQEMFLLLLQNSFGKETLDSFCKVPSLHLWRQKSQEPGHSRTPWVKIKQKKLWQGFTFLFSPQGTEQRHKKHHSSSQADW